MVHLPGTLIDHDTVVTIQPSNIDPMKLSTSYTTGFGSILCWSAAHRLLTFATGKGNWKPFTREEFANYHEPNPKTNLYALECLVSRGLIVEVEGFFYFTEDFVSKAYDAASVSVAETNP